MQSQIYYGRGPLLIRCLEERGKVLKINKIKSKTKIDIDQQDKQIVLFATRLQ